MLVDQVIDLLAFGRKLLCVSVQGCLGSPSPQGPYRDEVLQNVPSNRRMFRRVARSNSTTNVFEVFQIRDDLGKDVSGFERFPCGEWNVYTELFLFEEIAVIFETLQNVSDCQATSQRLEMCFEGHPSLI